MIIKDKLIFERIFRKYFGVLRNFALGIVKDKDEADEIVQEVFLKLWDSNHVLSEENRILPYLFSCVKNKAVDYLRHKAVEQKFINLSIREIKTNSNNYYNEMSEAAINDVKMAIDSLPPKCQLVFRLSRFENFSHKEIAFKLGISTKTVENHITKAISDLKKALIGYSRASDRSKQELKTYNRS